VKSRRREKGRRGRGEGNEKDEEGQKETEQRDGVRKRE